MFFSTIVKILLDNPETTFYISRMTWDNSGYIECNSNDRIFTLIDKSSGVEREGYEIGMGDIMGCDWRIE